MKEEDMQGDILGDDQETISYAQVEQVGTKLTTMLFRLNCPAPDDLLNYQWDLLSEEKSLYVAAHLAECPHCAHEAAQLSPPIVEPNSTSLSITSEVTEKLRFFIGHLSKFPATTAPVRSSTTDSQSVVRGNNPITEVYTISELSWDVTLSQWSEPDNTCIVQGQLLGASIEQISLFKVSLIQIEGPIVTTKLDDAGVFVFMSVPPGYYTLCFHTEQVKACIPNFHLT